MEGGFCGVVSGEDGLIWMVGCARASLSAGLWAFWWLGRCVGEVSRVYVVRLPRMEVLSRLPPLYALLVLVF